MNRTSSKAVGDNTTTPTIQDVCQALESLAPTALAQPWDNVGLLVGDPNSSARKVMLCIDLTHDVAQEAITHKIDLIVTYHPPLFKPVATIRADSHGTDALVHDCIRHGISIYSTHTALDAAPGGTNDILAELCGAQHLEPLEYVDNPSGEKFKLVVFAPTDSVEVMAQAMFQAGAGHIGDYTHCSYRSTGQGTFFGTESTKPAVGKRGCLESVEEVRIEMIVPSSSLPAVVAAMIKAHPYEEPAFDIYPVKPAPVKGIGRTGPLAQPTTTQQLAKKLQKLTTAPCVQIVGSPTQTVEYVVVVAGAAGSLPFKIPLTPAHVIVTGELRHHDALTIQRYGCTAIALGHWSSERPVLVPFSTQLKKKMPRLDVSISTQDREPFAAV